MFEISVFRSFAHCIDPVRRARCHRLHVQIRIDVLLERELNFTFLIGYSHAI
jgi:hypothetical protein